MTGQPHCARIDDATRPEGAPSVCLVAQLTLLSQAVAVALRSRGIRVQTAQLVGREWPSPPSEVGILLLLDDLAHARDLRRLLGLVLDGDGRVLVLTSHERDWYWGVLLAAGATSVMPSSASLDQVEATLKALHAGEACFDPEERLRLIGQWERFVADQHELAGRLSRLSPRERTVLYGLYGGSPVPELAERLGVAETTVRSQVKSILRKLGVRSQLSAIAMARRLENPTASSWTLTEAPRTSELERSAD
jgi:DNA-binding NarL/FixJ family response regulator